MTFDRRSLSLGFFLPSSSSSSPSLSLSYFFSSLSSSPLVQRRFRAVVTTHPPASTFEYIYIYFFFSRHVYIYIVCARTTNRFILLRTTIQLAAHIKDDVAILLRMWKKREYDETFNAWSNALPIGLKRAIRFSSSSPLSRSRSRSSSSSWQEMCVSERLLVFSKSL